MNFSHRTDYSSNDEIGALANDFNYLLEEIDSYGFGLEQEIERRNIEITKVWKSKLNKALFQ